MQVCDVVLLRLKNLIGFKRLLCMEQEYAARGLHFNIFYFSLIQSKLVGFGSNTYFPSLSIGTLYHLTCLSKSAIRGFYSFPALHKYHRIRTQHNVQDWLQQPYTREKNQPSEAFMVSPGGPQFPPFFAVRSLVSGIHNGP